MEQRSETEEVWIGKDKANQDSFATLWHFHPTARVWKLTPCAPLNTDIFKTGQWQKCLDKFCHLHSQIITTNSYLKNNRSISLLQTVNIWRQ